MDSIDNVSIFKYKNVIYYNIDDIYKNEINPDFFRGCKSNRKVVDKYKIPEK